MSKTWKVTLSDGTIINNLTLNGNNFISKTEITTDMFAGKLSHVTIEGPEDASDYGLRGEHGQMELARCQKDDMLGGWTFVLIDVPASELERRRIRGDIEYLAMMADIEL